MITVTESAVKQLQVLIAGHADATEKGLRIFVETGGCGGMQYGMAIDHRKEGDEVIECGSVLVLVDAFSSKHLNGSTVDFSNEVDGAGFQIRNPNAPRRCNCGEAFGPGDSKPHECNH